MNIENLNTISYFGQRGYTILKSSISPSIIEYIKKQLTFTPISHSNISQPEEFSIYLECDKKIYVPKFWGIDKFGFPKENRLPDGDNISLQFTGQLRDYQNNVITSYLKSVNFTNDTQPSQLDNSTNLNQQYLTSSLISLGCGKGKTVIALKILTILQKKTIIFVHKTFLKNQWIERINQFIPNASIGTIQGEIIDVENHDIVIAMIQSISMKAYPKHLFNSFGLSIYDECFKGNTLIHTNKGKIKIEELYDIWNKRDNIEILSFNREKEIFEYKPLTYAWKKESKEFIKFTLSKQKLECTLNHKILTPNGYIEANKLEIGSLILSKYDINHNENFICPYLNEDQLQIVYGSFLGDGCIQKTKSNRYRLRIIHCKNQKDYCLWKANMFGINKLNYIEKNGYLQKQAYSFNTKCFDLIDEINDSKIVPEIILNNINEKGIAIWFMDNGSIMKKELKNKTISYFAKISSINFDYTNHLILVRIFEKWNIIPKIMKCKKYYELHFDKNNTQKLFDLIMPYIHENLLYKTNNSNCIKYKWNNNFLNYGTLKITKKEYISNKKANVYDIEVKDNHNFILATKSNTNYIDGPIVSNCHHMSSRVFCNCFKVVQTKYSLGLSATLERKDGLTCVFKLFLGDVCYQDLTETYNNVLVKVVHYKVIDDEFNTLELDYRGNVKYSTMITKLSNYTFRNDFIIQVIFNELKVNRDQQILVLSHNKSVLNYFNKQIKISDYSCGFYIGGMREQDLKTSESKQIILATYAMAAEALDIKTLTTLVLTTPKTDITQAVGRILRSPHSQPVILDFVDQHSTFLNQYKKRQQFYNQKKYKTIEINSEDYLNYIKTNNQDLWKEKVLRKTKKTDTKAIIDIDTDSHICLI